MTTLMPEFRQQLLDAAAARSRGRGRLTGSFGAPRLRLPRLRRPLGTSLAAVTSILVVVAVMAVVLTAGRAHHGPTAPGGQPSGGVPSVAAARAQLLGELGALRHGHASPLAAHLPLFVSPQQIDRSLVRTVQTDGYTLTLIPVSYTVGGPRPRQRTTGLIVMTQGPDVPKGFPAIANPALAVAEPVSPAAIARHGAITTMYVDGTLNRAIVIVPDGVTRVRLSQFVPDRSSPGRLAALAPASAPVHDNVAVLSIPGVTAAALHQTQQTVRDQGGLYSTHHCHMTAALYFVSVSARMTWWRHTDTGLKARTTTVHTSLNAYSTTLLGPVPCRHSPKR